MAQQNVICLYIILKSILTSQYIYVWKIFRRACHL